MTDMTRVHDEVRERYAEAARAATANSRDSAAQASCCSPSGEVAFGELLYAADERATLPEAAVLASLGCGNPTAVAELRQGETVLDLGSGGGIDVLLSARRVGPSGRAIGLDMTDEMLELARRNAAEAGASNVVFVKGTIESMPLATDSVDVVISNCVINLAADKGAVFGEIARVLRPGGTLPLSTDNRRNVITRTLNGPRWLVASLLGKRNYRVKHRFPHRSFSRRELDALMADSGLVVERMRTFRFSVVGASPVLKRFFNRIDARLPDLGVGDLVVVVARRPLALA